MDPVAPAGRARRQGRAAVVGCRVPLPDDRAAVPRTLAANCKTRLRDATLAVLRSSRDARLRDGTLGADGVDMRILILGFIVFIVACGGPAKKRTTLNAD